MMTMMGSAVIAPALPAIQRTLDVPAGSIGLLLTAFSLPGIISIPITGVLADRYGRKRVIVPLLFLYGVAGALGALAPNFESLLALRFLAGIGASSLGTLTLVLIGDLYDGRERAAALGYRIALGQASNGVFPVLGGLLAVFGWQFPFLLFIFAVPVGLMVLAVLERDEARPPISLGEYARQIWRTVANRRIAGLLSVSPSLMVINQGVFLTFFPILMNDDFAASSVLIGVVLSARVVFGALVASQISWLVDHVGEERLVIGSFVILAAALAMVPLMPGLWYLIVPSILIGMSMGAAFPAFQALLVSASPDAMRAAILSANGVTNRIGQTLGPVIAGLVFVIAGSGAVFFTGAVFIFLMAMFLRVMLRRAQA